MNIGKGLIIWGSILPGLSHAIQVASLDQWTII